MMEWSSWDNGDPKNQRNGIGYLDPYLNLTVVFLLFYGGIINFKVKWGIFILNRRILLEDGWRKDYLSDNW